MSEQPHPPEFELIERIRSVDVRAPEALHERVAALVAERTERRRWGLRPRPRRPAFAGALAAAVGAAAILVAIAVFGGGGGTAPTPTILRSASTLTLGGATAGAPRENRMRRGELLADVEGVAFPYWEESFGWRATGARSGTIAGRPVTTVYYTNGNGARIGYAIIGGSPPPRLSGDQVRWLDGTDYRVLELGGQRAVVWLRSGRLCVVSGRGVDASTLLRLASWHEGAATTA